MYKNFSPSPTWWQNLVNALSGKNLVEFLLWNDLSKMSKNWNISFCAQARWLACANFNAADKLDGRGINLKKCTDMKRWKQIWKKTSIKFEQTLKQPERTITNLETLENKYVAKAILRLFSKFLDNRRTFSWQPSFGLSLRQRDASRRTPDISVKANRWRWRKQSPHHFWAEHGACTHTVSQKQASHGCKLIDLTQPRLPCASLGTVESQVSMVWFCF